jgi:hypothetical protein
MLRIEVIKLGKVSLDKTLSYQPSFVSNSKELSFLCSIKNKKSKKKTFFRIQKGVESDGTRRTIN